MNIERATSRPDFEEARQLIALMAAWDITESRTLGIGDKGVLDAYYGDTPDMMIARFSAPGAGLLVCRIDGAAVGCGAFSAAGDGAAELHKMFVKPGHRGKGIGKALLTAILAEMKQCGYASARLETVQFMTEAIGLYRAFGFVAAEPFHDRPENFRAVTLFLQKPL